MVNSTLRYTFQWNVNQIIQQFLYKKINVWIWICQIDGSRVASLFVNVKKYLNDVHSLLDHTKLQLSQTMPISSFCYQLFYNSRL